jgi:hypothetical protein
VPRRWRPYEGQARGKHEDAREINDWWYLDVVEMKLNKRELGNEYCGKGGARETADLFGVRQRSLREWLLCGLTA